MKDPFADFSAVKGLGFEEMYTELRKQIKKSRLADLDESDVTYFLHFHLRAIDDFGQYLVQEKKTAHDALSKYPGINTRQPHLLLELIHDPKKVVTVKQHQNGQGVAHDTARSDLYDLVERGLLTQVQAGCTFHFVAGERL